MSKDLHSFCDFCVYTPVDVAVERIYPCREWEETCIPQLEDDYDKHRYVTRNYSSQFVITQVSFTSQVRSSMSVRVQCTASSILQYSIMVT